jgi:hypothetical protein
VALGTECGWRWLTEVLELAERVRRARLAGTTWGGVGDGVWLEMADEGPAAHAFFFMLSYGLIFF